MPKVMPRNLKEMANRKYSIACVLSRIPSLAIRLKRDFSLLRGILIPGSYLLFLYAVAIAPVGQLAPMREIGTVFGTMLGIVFLKEKHGKSHGQTLHDPVSIEKAANRQP